MNFVEEISSAQEESDSQCNQIEVHNVPAAVSDKLLKAYFEGARSGGCTNAVAKCEQTQKGVFIVTFHDPKG